MYDMVVANAKILASKSICSLPLKRGWAMRLKLCGDVAKARLVS